MMFYKEKEEPELREELFENPGAAYRGAPFWAWNKKLNKKGYSFDKIMVLEYIIEYCDHHELFEEGYGYQKELLKILQKNH